MPEKPKAPKPRWLVAGPFVGEFGWEAFAWQPLIRAMFLRDRYDNALVYTRPGRRWMYRFGETRTLPGLPNHEPECMAWTGFAAHRKDLDAATTAMIEAAKAEAGVRADLSVHTYANLGNLADPQHHLGMPDLLYPDPCPRDRWFANDGRPKVALAVRDRGMSQHRNWPYGRWAKLAGLLAAEFDVAVVGLVGRPVAWRMPPTVRDWTNRTTVDDLIAVFSRADLAVGGSSGGMHLASRCGCDHLVWGAENATIFPLSNRWTETNWFGARLALLLEDAWDPQPETVAEHARRMVSMPRFQPRVVLTFDDCTADQFAAAKYLHSLGLRAVFGAVTGKVGSLGFCSWEQLYAMKKMGHVVCSHSHFHHLAAPDSGRRHLRPVGGQGVLADAIAAKEELRRRGLDHEYHLVPFGTANAVSQDVLKELASQFSWVRLTVGAPHPERGWIPSGMHRHLPGGWAGRTCGITAAADVRWPGRVRRRLDECVRAGTTCVLLYHRVDHVVGEAMDLTWADFKADADYLAALAKGGRVDVVTPKEIAG